MCGIVALWSAHAPIDAEALERATRRLHHRGPDGRRQWIAPHRRVGLGHARLSIIDLHTGDQPIASEDERLHIVANGEFYDHERAQRELEQAGHRLRTRSDSEIALHLYEDLGTQCLHRLRGEFAFVVWDEPNQTLFAARDRFGIKPLFYAERDGGLALASEAKALFAAGIPARWNQAGFVQATSLLVPEQDSSLFEGSDRSRPVTICWRHRAAFASYATGTSTTRGPTRRRPAPMPSTPRPFGTSSRKRCASACAPTSPWAAT